MGIYAIVCCHASNEYIEPGHVNDGAIKEHHIPYRGDLGRLLLHLLSSYAETPWTDIRIVTDDSSGYESVRMNYLDITKHAIESYNKAHPGAEQLLYTKK